MDREAAATAADIQPSTPEVLRTGAVETQDHAKTLSTFFPFFLFCLTVRPAFSKPLATVSKRRDQQPVAPESSIHCYARKRIASRDRSIPPTTSPHSQIPATTPAPASQQLRRPGAATRRWPKASGWPLLPFSAMQLERLPSPLRCLSPSTPFPVPCRPCRCSVLPLP
jgi:hypothetical protein